MVYLFCKGAHLDVFAMPRNFCQEPLNDELTGKSLPPRLRVAPASTKDIVAAVSIFKTLRILKLGIKLKVFNSLNRRRKTQHHLLILWLQYLSFSFKNPWNFYTHPTCSEYLTHKKIHLK